jgi:hypothetical protein
MPSIVPDALLVVRELAVGHFLDESHVRRPIVNTMWQHTRVSSRASVFLVQKFSRRRSAASSNIAAAGTQVHVLPALDQPIPTISSEKNLITRCIFDSIARRSEFLSPSRGARVL